MEGIETPRAEFYVNKDDPFDLSDADWGFNYPAEVVRQGYIMWRASGFKRMPTMEEAASINERWVSDMNRIARIVRFHTEDNSVMGFDLK